EYRPKEYLYGNDPQILTQFELEDKIFNNDFHAETVVMIQCVGSRNEEHPYCSRICCTHSIKNALKIKELHPQTEVYILYRDIRAYGFREAYYTKAREAGVIFIRYNKDEEPQVSNTNGHLSVKVKDALLGTPVEIRPDLISLAAAIVPGDSHKELAQALKVALTEDNFFLEAHRKLRPVDFAAEGIFMCGLSHSPMGVDECISQASGAAARATTILSRETLELEPTISHLIEEKCDGCAYCVDPCPFKAITLFEYEVDGQTKKMVKVDESQCKGCGTCMATCPKDAIFVWHFKLDQLRAMVNEALNVE
ncbi:MAG: CoB--CoM heterodisulfide reductase iron-sulfur subunit A family protein, partial [Fidelibacterota bacterium]